MGLEIITFANKQQGHEYYAKQKTTECRPVNNPAHFVLPDQTLTID